MKTFINLDRAIFRFPPLSLYYFLLTILRQDLAKITLFLSTDLNFTLAPILPLFSSPKPRNPDEKSEEKRRRELRVTSEFPRLFAKRKSVSAMMTFSSFESAV